MTALSRVLAALALGFFALAAPAQAMRPLEFKDQEMRDILLVLAELNKVSIFPDETVQGKTSFYFSSMDLETALRLFSEANKLQWRKKDGLYYVSRLRIEVQSLSKLVSVDCADTPLRDLVHALSKEAGTTILYDQVPSDSLCLHAEALPLGEVLEMAIAKYPDLELDTRGSYFYIRKRDRAGPSPSKPGRGFFKLEEDRFTIEVEKAKFRDLALDLFEKAGKEVVFLLDQDLVLENLSFRRKSFEEMLKLLLLKVGADFSVSEGVYYLMEAQRRDLQSKFLTTLIIPLQNISVQDFLRLVPPGLNSGSKMKADEKDNKVVLSGTAEELKALVDFIAMIDTRETNSSTIRIDLSYLRSDEALPLLPSEFSCFAPVALPSKTGFVINLPANKVQKLMDLVALVDRQDRATPITLNFIKAEELLASLPPSVTDQNVKKTTDPRMVFFKGTEAMKQAFLRDLGALDHPKAQIKYQLLVLALTDNDSDDWQSGLSAQHSGGTQGAVLKQGLFKDVLAISFDVIDSFGVDFCMSLQWKLAKNKARVIADTTLSALSGERVTFKNTSTVRVKDTEQSSSSSSSSGSTSTEIIREISSGLFMNIEGWVSGSRMITMKIDSTLSDNLTTDSSNSLPKTTEKVMTTTVRTEVGRPIAVTGLKQQQAEESVAKVPLLGDIPLLGWLFTTRNKTSTTTNYLIYILPRLEMPELNREALERGIVEDYYRYLFAQDAGGAR